MDNLITFERDGFKFNCLYADAQTRRDHKTRIFVSDQDEVTEMEQPPPSLKGDDPENDKLWRRYNKLEIAKQREVLDAGVALLNGSVGGSRFFAPGCGPIGIKFSRHAGCSCPCSPGFVADRTLYDAEYRQLASIFISKPKPSAAPERTFTFADLDVANAH